MIHTKQRITQLFIAMVGNYHTRRLWWFSRTPNH